MTHHVHIAAETTIKGDLWEQIKFAAYGHSANDVGAIASGMLMQCLVLKSLNREHALMLADMTFTLMREIIERDYEQMVSDLAKEPPRN
jgi:hypothetical protein